MVIQYLWNLLFPLFILLLAIGQRRYYHWGWIALLAEFFLLMTVTFWAGTTVTFCVFLPYALFFALDYRIYQCLGGALDFNALRFGLTEPAQTIDLFRTEFGWRGLGVLLSALGAAVLSALLAKPSTQAVMAALSVVSLIVLGVAIVREGMLPPVPSLLSAFLGMIRNRSQQMGLTRAERMRLPSEQVSKENPPNILVIVIESLCKRLLYSPEGKEAAPRYHAFLAGESGRVVPFPSALCNSTISLMSYPSIFTGLAPDQSSERFHSNPLIWAHAKARGYATSLYTSQSLRWCNFDHFLLDDTLDRAAYLESLKAPIFYAQAMDDRALNQIIKAELAQMDKPFFSVVNYHMLHFPYSDKGGRAESKKWNGTDWSASSSSKEKENIAPKAMESRGLYLDALQRFDICFGDLLDTLESSGKLKNTVVFFTGDHGEAPERMYPGTGLPKMLRLDDFNTDVLRVPFWVYLPEDAVPEQGEARLRANSGAIVSNIDIYPSVMDLLGYDAAKRKEWSSGQSIFDSINPERSVIALNTGALRQWKYEPFALAREGWLLIYHDITQLLELIRLDDPQETDVWESLPPSEQEAWLAEIEKTSLEETSALKRRIFQRAFKKSGSTQMVRARVPSEPASKENPPNVLLIVCDSFCKRVLDSPEGIQTAPRYHAFLAKESGRVVSFSSALSNSAARGLSYPSLFTGLAPDQERESFNRNPLIWAHAKARGYATFLHTSQSLRWCNLDHFLLDDTLDRAVYRESLNAPAFNDLAMDDLALNEIAIADLAQTSGPFFSVVNYNMLHFPYANGEAKTAASAAESRDLYLNALRKFDKCLGDLLDKLESSGKMERTIIFFTASHGEALERTDFGSERSVPLRVNDLDTDILRVPFWVYLPEGAVSKKREAQLRANSGTVVSNIDIYPSVMDLLGYSFAKRKEWCSGQSLFGSINPERSVIALNTGALRQWKYEPFALARDGCLLLFHDFTERIELIRLDDPLETNFWETLTPSELAPWVAAIEKKPALKTIFKNRGFTPLSVQMCWNSIATDTPTKDLYQLSGWGFSSREDWDEMCRNTGVFIGMEKGDHVFECGCGTGAFLKVLIDHWGARVAGVDMAEKTVEIARQSIPGEFWVGDIQNLSFIPSGTYDKVVSQGVFLYLPTPEAVTRAALEMIRIAKPGGVIYIGILNDPQRLEAHRNGKKPSGNALVGRDFWMDFASQYSLSIEIVDQDAIYTKPDGYDAFSSLRYSVRMKKEDGPTRNCFSRELPQLKNAGQA